MKSRLFVLVFALCWMHSMTFAQDLNWAQVQKEQQHFVAAKFGADYATVLGLSYGYRLPGKNLSFVSAELSSPFGRDLLDDWKLRLAYQLRVWQGGKLGLSLKPGLILRKYDSNIAKVLNVGIDLNTALGYYRPKWFIAAEAGVDHSLASKLKQGSLKENYPGIYEGWIGSTGGNFKFGGHLGYSFGTQLASLRLGKVYAQNFRDNPTLPFYFELTLLKIW
ncbi:hypothetical protein [Haliscomenobacter sp.]|uniref:hypothetical protein n=1 Tax=Haliscomenobacter sp. TaxID=2717303 RepID=UPI00359452AB